jgi:uncharacterized protein (TIGR01777 family)
METVLITGATGMIGGQLIPLLIDKGFKVRVLTRNKTDMVNSAIYVWDISENYIDPAALEGVDHIIHLSGSTVSERWTKTKKQEILDSRIKAANLIFDNLKHPIKSFISASGISYYGTKTTGKIFLETDTIKFKENDFLADVTQKWEKAALQFETKADRVVLVRTPIVLSKSRGALETMLKPIKMGLGAPLGTGKQWMPWVHVSDLCNFYALALSNSEIAGPYNIVAPHHVSNKIFMRTLAKTVGKKLWFIKVPAFVLKIVFGKMSSIILKGSRVDGSKATETGFKYEHPQLKEALQDLLNK